ncbi:MAG: hypothetical protein M4579_005703 [Chaenotheca gracillima]|nr:MAG: hypothetical protein M4579_005703 [Chaenotheca gracillima]
MPPVGAKSKSKGRDSRRSRSRNTTPSSIGTSSTHAPATVTAYLETPLAQLMVPTNISYEDILERHGSGAGIPDPRHLETLTTDLNTLVQLAEARNAVCDQGMRRLGQRRKERVEEEREKEQRDREDEQRREHMKKEAALRAEEDEAKEKKGSKGKHRKDRSRIREQSRPLAHGAHGLARQDGMDVEMKGSHRLGSDSSIGDFVNTRLIDASSPPEAKVTKKDASPSKVKRETTSTSISSLSPSSQAQSPPTAPAAPAAPSASTPTPAAPAEQEQSNPSSPASSSSLSEHQPPPAPAVPQYQTFGPDPSTFDDPTIYHIREVTPEMTEEEIQEIYSVSHYPHDDLHDLIPGIPPDRDLSNAKPSNQVAANTFATYIEPYFRQFTEEDLAFLRERGDRTGPFVIPRRGKRHYSEIWAEEDGAMSIDSPPSNTSLPANQPRGNIEQMSDEVAETEQVSSGPLLQRLLSSMRPEHRPDPEEKPLMNGAVNGEGSVNGIKEEMNGEAEAATDGEKPLAAATFIPDSTQPGWKIPTTKLDYGQVDERLKQELRYIGFLGENSEPDYDAHYDDEIAARLRHLQAELKEQSIINGARKARIAELAKVRLAHQEYTQILEDLDNQVQQAYLKRTRTLGKGKKQQKRPGGAGGGSHFVGGGGNSGVSRPGIGDVARTLMDRRKRWIDVINPVFDDGMGRIPSNSIFDTETMTTLVDKEREGWEEGEE